MPSNKDSISSLLEPASASRPANGTGHRHEWMKRRIDMCASRNESSNHFIERGVPVPFWCIHGADYFQHVCSTRRLSIFFIPISATPSAHSTPLTLSIEAHFFPTLFCSMLLFMCGGVSLLLVQPRAANRPSERKNNIRSFSSFFLFSF